MSGQPHPMGSLVGVQNARSAGRASNAIQTPYRQERISVYPIFTLIEQLNTPPETASQATLPD